MVKSLITPGQQKRIKAELQATAKEFGLKVRKVEVWELKGTSCNLCLQGRIGKIAFIIEFDRTVTHPWGWSGPEKIRDRYTLRIRFHVSKLNIFDLAHCEAKTMSQAVNSVKRTLAGMKKQLLALPCD